VVPGAVFEAGAAGLTMRARPVLPAAGLAFRESARGGAVISLGVNPAADEWFTVDENTGGLRIKPEMIES